MPGESLPEVHGNLDLGLNEELGPLEPWCPGMHPYLLLAYLLLAVPVLLSCRECRLYLADTQLS